MLDFFLLLLFREEKKRRRVARRRRCCVYRKLNYKNTEAANLTGNPNRCIRENKIPSGPTGTTIAVPPPCTTQTFLYCC